MNQSTVTREAWLKSAIVEMGRTVFKQHGPVPSTSVSIGLPKGRGSKKIIGQCWASRASDNQLPTIFISPTIGDTDLVLATLAHELVHAIDDCVNGHKAAFKRTARAIGLEGKLTATFAGPALKIQLNTIKEKLGEIPHSKLNVEAGPVKKQTARMIKMTCRSCGYIARTAQKNIDAYGPTFCPCNSEPMEITN